jgi:hypothetical protein
MPSTAPAPPVVPTEPGFVAAQPLPSGPSGLAALDPETLTLIGLGIATFFYVVLLVSPFLAWRSLGGANLSYGDINMNINLPVHNVKGTVFGDGRMLFCLTLAMLVIVAVNFLNRRFLTQAMVLGGAFATFVILMMLAWVSSGQAGVILGLIAALGAAGGCIWTAVRQPFLMESPLLPGGLSFFRTYGALLAGEAAALVLGVLYCLLRVIFGG